MPAACKDLIAFLRQMYRSLTKSEQKITDYVIKNQNDTQYMTITELARVCNVADATLTRYCRKLGFGGFADFKLSLAKSCAADVEQAKPLMYGEILSDDTIEQICEKLYIADKEAIYRTYSSLDLKKVSEAVDLIQKSARVLCYGQGGTSVAAMEIWGRFLTVSPKFQWIQDDHMQAIAASMLEPGDVILYFCFSGATREMLDVCKIIDKQKGIHLVLITSRPQSPGTVYADVVLCSAAAEGPLQAGSMASKMGFLYICDVLFNEFCRRNMKASMKSRNMAAEAVAGKML